MPKETARLPAPFKCLSAACYHETMCGILVISTMLLGRGQEGWAFGCHPIISFIGWHQSYRSHLPLFYLFIFCRMHFVCFLRHVGFLSSYFTVDISWYAVAALPIPTDPAYLKGWLHNPERVHEHAWAHTGTRATTHIILSFMSEHLSLHLLPPSVRLTLSPKKIESRNKWRLHSRRRRCCCSRAEIIFVFPLLAPDLVTNAQEPSAL